MDLYTGRLKPNRCRRCLLTHELCFCDRTTQFDNQTWVSLLIHHKEVRKASNSGRLLCRSLTRSSMHIHGTIDVSLNDQSLIRLDCEPVLLFPRFDSVPVQDFRRQTDKPLQLFVPDGNWGQASRLSRRTRCLSELPAVHVIPEAATAYKIRSHPDPLSLGTMEAAAMALGVLEHPSLCEGLMDNFHLLVERNLVARGKIPRRRLFASDHQAQRNLHLPSP